MAALFRYAAFISYSSKDSAFAKRLHRALERYGIPNALGRFDLIGGGKKNRIYPVFRDREELPAGNLGEHIEAALAAAGALVVVCSPHGARSPWVQKEIEYFIGLGRLDRIFAIIADTAPLLDQEGRDATNQSFPEAFRGSGLADSNALEPLAGDARKGKDGFRNAWLKVVAGIIGVTPGQLIDRDRRRRRQQTLALSAGAAVFLLGVWATVAGVAESNRRFRELEAAQRLLNETGDPAHAVSVAVGALPPNGSVLSADTAGASRFVTTHGGLHRAAISDFEREVLGGPITLRSSRDGRWIVSVDGAGRFCVLDGTTLAVRKCTERLAAALRNIALVDSDRAAVVSSSDGWLIRLSVPGAEEMQRRRVSQASLDGLASSGNRLVAADNGGFVHEVDPASLQARSNNLGVSWIRTIAIERDTGRLALADTEGTVRLVSPSGATPLCSMPGNAANDLAFWRGGVLAAFENGIVLWCREGRQVVQARLEGVPVRSVQVLAERNLAIVAWSRGRIAVLSPAGMTVFDAERTEVSTAALTADGRQFIFGTQSGVVERWSVEPIAPVPTASALCDGAAAARQFSEGALACRRRGLLGVLQSR